MCVLRCVLGFVLAIIAYHELKFKKKKGGGIIYDLFVTMNSQNTARFICTSSRSEEQEVIEPYISGGANANARLRGILEYIRKVRSVTKL